jgi:hypothetical protein
MLRETLLDICESLRYMNLGTTILQRRILWQLRLFPCLTTRFFKGSILGQMVLAFIRKRHGALLDQEQCQCPECGRVLKKRGMHKRREETLAGEFELERPYFYCTHCSLGMYPL